MPIINIKYYYFRDKQNKPRITVCLLKIGKQIARGISICSAKDNPCKITGRNIARGRARKAIFAEKSDYEINRKAAFDMAYDAFSEIYGDLIFDHVYKSTYNPLLTDFERKLLTNTPKEYIQQKTSFEIDCKIRMQSL